MKVELSETKRHHCIKVQDLYAWLCGQEEVCLYGAGNVCKKFLLWSEKMSLQNRIKGIFVTEKSGNAEQIMNIPVKSAYELNADLSCGILLTVSENLYDEILETLHELNVSNFVCVEGDFLYFLDKNLEKNKIDSLVNKIRKQSMQSNGGDIDILFLTPPYWDLYAPFSAVPSLTAILKERGFVVRQEDLGIRAIHHGLIKYWKSAREYCLSKKFYTDNIKPYKKNYYRSYEEYSNDMFFLQGDHFELSEVRKKYWGMNQVQRRVLDALYQYIYSIDASFVDFDKMNSIQEALELWNKDAFLDTLLDGVSVNLLTNLPDVIGISVTSREQFLPACILSEICRELNHNTKIIMGGSCADIFMNSNYSYKQEIYKYFDYIIIGEGETAILGIMNYLQGNISSRLFDEVPNILHIDENGRAYVVNQVLENVEELPPPDYSGLDLDMYLSPEPVIPYQASRGCHYGHCAFCNHDEKYRHNYRMKSAKKVVNDLLHIHHMYGVKNFQFVDEAIRPDHFREIVTEMDKHDECKEFKWIFYSRVSREYDEEILQVAKRNGCEMVMFGVETLNQRLLNFIKKGILADVSRFSLKLFHKNGIKTYAWLMCNLPSETLEEAENDLNDIKKVIDYIDAFSVGMFYLDRNTDMSKNLEKFNITCINEDNRWLFQSHFNGEIIDKEAMIKFFETKYQAYQKEHFSCGNRYTLFFS